VQSGSNIWASANIQFALILQPQLPNPALRGLKVARRKCECCERAELDYRRCRRELSDSDNSIGILVGSIFLALSPDGDIDARLDEPQGSFLSRYASLSWAELRS
jgi:hypothetical protein